MKWILLILIATIAITPQAFAFGFGECNFGNYEFGNCIAPATTPPGGGGGGGTSLANAGFPEFVYTLKVKLSSLIYHNNDIIKATIAINNTGKITITNATLTYYLQSPLGNKVNETRERIESIPATFTTTKNIQIPKDAKPGQWKFLAKYGIKQQEQSFTIIRKESIFPIAAGIGFIMLFLSLITAFMTVKWIQSKKKQ